MIQYLCTPLAVATSTALVSAVYRPVKSTRFSRNDETHVYQQLDNSWRRKLVCNTAFIHNNVSVSVTKRCIVTLDLIHSNDSLKFVNSVHEGSASCGVEDTKHCRQPQAIFQGKATHLTKRS